MLSKEIFKQEIENLVYAYPTWKMKYTEPKAMRTWYRNFESMNDSQFIKMVDKYIKTQTWNPTIAGLLKCKEELEDFQC